MSDQIGMNKRIYREHTDWVYTVSWLSDQRLTSAGRDKTIRVWDVPGTPNRDDLVTHHEHKKRINSVACSPDGQYIASASEDKTVRIYRVSSPRGVLCLEDHHQPVNSVAWSPKPAPNGDLLLVSGGDDAVVRIWQLPTSGDDLECLSKGSFQNHVQTQRLKRWINGTGINALAWSPDGQLIASAGDDKTVRIWKWSSGGEVRCYEKHTRRINALAWSVDGTLIASAGDDQSVHIWEFDTGNQVQVIKPDPQPNLIQRTLVNVRPMKGQRPAHTTRLLPPQRPLFFGIVTALAWSPSLDDQKLALASQKVVHLFEKNQRRVSLAYTYRQHTDWVRTVAWSPDGTRIASAGDDKRVYVWNSAFPPRMPDPDTTSLDEI